MKRIRLKSSGLTIVSVVLVLLIFFHWLGALTWLDNLVLRAFAPINSSLYQFGFNVSQSYHDANDQRNSAELIRQKDEQIAQLLKTNAELAAIKKDDQVLRAYFKLFAEDKFNYVMAKVLSRDIISRDAVSRNKLIINRGASDGLMIGFLVVDQNGAAVGKISKLKDHLAEVSLINSNDCQLAVAVQNEDQTIGVAQGDLGLMVRLDFVPQSQKLSEGQLVVSSGLEPDIPSNIIVGKIKTIDSASINNIWQKVSLEPIANLDNLSWLAVVVPKEPFSF